MAEMDHNLYISNDCCNVSHQNIDLLVHPTPSGPYSPSHPAPDLGTAVFSRRHHAGVPDCSTAPVPAAQGHI